MRSITTIIPTTLIVSLFFFVALIFAPAPAKADAIDDLLTRVQSVMEEMAKIQQDLQALKAAQSTTASASTAGTPVGTVAGARTFKFTSPVVFGEDNDDIFKVQQLLKTDVEIYPAGTVSGYFGPKTENAIKNLQTRFGLDPVGVVGPATTALLERLLSEQKADGTFPGDILDPARPTGEVAGVSTSAVTENPLVQNLLEQVAKLEAQKEADEEEEETKTVSTKKSSSGVDRIKVEIDDGEALVKIFYTNGDFKDFWASSDDEDDIVDEAADETGLSTSAVEDLIDFGKYKSKSDDADDIDEILIDVDVEDGVAEVTIVFEDEDEDEDEFEVDEVDLEDIIEEIADELDIDEDDVRDLMDVDYNVNENDIDEINAVIDGNETEVTVELESGDDFEFWLEEDNEDDVIEETAELLDIDESDIEDLIDIDEE
jgi:peptidoglycan hydrolase-like protein with peptidoglycan-binding domain